MQLFIYPPIAVSVSVPPLGFILDGAETEVSRDTGTPGNSVPLPVIQLDGSGNVATPLTDTQLRATPVPVSVSGVSTEAKQDSQITQATSTNTKLDTLIAKDFATGVKQDTGNTSLGSIDTKLSSQATAAKQDALLAELQLKADLSETQPVSVASLPLPSGAATEAKQDAQTAELQDIEADVEAISAKLPATLGQKAMAASLAVVLSSDQSVIPVAQGSRAGSFQEDLALSTVVTFTAPANSKWFMIQADDTNSANIRWKVGAAATTTSGMQLQPGRSEQVDIGGDVSVIAESGTQKVAIQFGV